MAGPLTGLRVLDLTTLLPGPYATLLLAEAGAEVVKVEPPAGDPILALPAGPGVAAAAHTLLNAGKRILRLDLRDAGSADVLRREVEAADVLVEQFRPGVMDRLGFGYRTVRRWNPGLIYCSITGYGQSGPDAAKAGHDLNFLAEAGLLDADAEGVAEPPPVLAADIGGGALPAVVNILLALLERRTTGRGRHLDIAMARTVRCFAFPHLPAVAATGRLRTGEAGGLLGGSPRYAVYPTADGRRLAVAALEPKFWTRFCSLIGLPDELCDDAVDPAATRAAIAGRLAQRSAGEWLSVFAGHDVCVSLVSRPEESLRGVTRYPTPLDPALTASAEEIA
ncbi:CoA transferase [Azospirillum sp. RWY-5-1]|uniref:CoA transferase n=1 Tax=Azospirillum oleiclasticum TaxID=2735135 RepID=A0ABX2TCU5_9PROT|nr:CaiB/BaiF CoA-transferase family protein [Azospirillum oleiclasticum]NYZ15823.1 CoA transferase [Azospirillum oleiclasticum]NYZ22093.1 CoA transferase [Azospirillum oleiclasticum]